MSDQQSLVAHLRRANRTAMADSLEKLTPREFAIWKADFAKRHSAALGGAR